jgi:hypothetical protein
MEDGSAELERWSRWLHALKGGRGRIRLRRGFGGQGMDLTFGGGGLAGIEHDSNAADMID